MPDFSKTAFGPCSNRTLKINHTWDISFESADTKLISQNEYLDTGSPHSDSGFASGIILDQGGAIQGWNEDSNA